MKICVNGGIQEVAQGVTVEKLLQLNKVEMPEMVSVQLNGKFLNREKFAHTVIGEDDQIDFLYFMGGGGI